MGYGCIGVWGDQVALVTAYDSSYGEDRSGFMTIDGFPTKDVAIQTALNSWDIFERTQGDNATMAIKSYVDGGINQDFGDAPAGWGLYVSTSDTTSIRFGYFISGNGSWMRGSYHVTFWGDPDDGDNHHSLHVESERAQVVYDPSSLRVVHVDHRVTLSGPHADSVDSSDDVLASARALGHAGELSVLEVPPADVRGQGVLRVDLGTNRLVSEPRASRG
jgi:hypothetical protein